MLKNKSEEVELVLGQAAKHLFAGLKQLEEVTKKCQELPNTVETYELKIANSEAKLAELTNKFELEKQNITAELEILRKTKIEEMLTNHCSQMKKVLVPVEYYTKLTTELDELKKDFAAKVSSEVNAKINYVQKDFETKSKLVDAEYKTKEAQNLALIDQLKNQLSSASAQAAEWREALNSERAASIERSKHSAIGAVNVGQPTR